MAYATRTLAVGDCVPGFYLPDQDGAPLGTGDMVGVPWVAFFYGGDHVPACRDIALAFRDWLAEFNALPARVIGISADQIGERLAFAEANDIPFPLLCDPALETSRAFGVAAAMSEGEQGVDYQRTALLVDANLRVMRIYQPFAADDVLRVLHDLLSERWPGVSPLRLPDPLTGSRCRAR